MFLTGSVNLLITINHLFSCRNLGIGYEVLVRTKLTLVAFYITVSHFHNQDTRHLKSMHDLLTLP